MRVFLLDVGRVSQETVKRLAATLPPFRREAADRCNNALYPQNVLGFCLVRYAVRQLDPAADTEHWVIDPRGKPRLAAGEVHFNLSHTAHCIAVAVSDREAVGIDVEAVKPLSERFLQRYFSACEQALIHTPEDAIRIWSAKEAEAKRTGAGLASGVASIRIDRVQSAPITAGGHAHLLSLSPADALPEITWVSAEALL